MTRHIVADEVLTRPESLAEAKPLARLPATPFAFIWYLVRTHFPRRVAVLVSLAALASTIDAFVPLALSHVINAIGAAYAKHLDFGTAVLPGVVIMAAIWLVSASVYRGYEAVGHRHDAAHARARAEISLRLHAGPQPPLFPGQLRRQARAEDQAGGPGDRLDPSTSSASTWCA